MIRKLFEQWAKSKTKEELLLIKRRLSIIYAVAAWNLFGALFYTAVKDKIPIDPKERRATYKFLTANPNNYMHVYQIKGMTLTNQFGAEDKKNDENETAVDEI